MILGHMKRSIAPTVEGGESLALACAGQTTLLGVSFWKRLRQMEHVQERVTRIHERHLKGKAYEAGLKEPDMSNLEMKTQLPATTPKTVL